MYLIPWTVVIQKCEILKTIKKCNKINFNGDEKVANSDQNRISKL